MESRDSQGLTRRNSMSAIEPGRSGLTQSGRHGYCIETSREFVVDVAQRDAEIIVDGREFGAAQFLVDRQEIEISFRPGFADLECALGCVHADEAEPAHQLDAR